MITAERLKELIKQRATIWSDTLWYTGKIYLTNNDTDEYQILKDIDNNYVYLNHHKKGTDHIYDGGWCLEDLREDVDRAEWEYKTTAERTERFEPPMWEDLQEDLEVIDYKFAFTINGNCNYLFWVAKDERGSSIEIRKFNVYKVETTLFYSDSATKENYIKACEIVRDLFNKGGAK